jgi:hypothetical protein
MTAAAPLGGGRTASPTAGKGAAQGAAKGVAKGAANKTSHAAVSLSTWWFWLTCLLLSVMLVLPLWTHAYPGMTDYPNHLARAQIIVDAQLHQQAHPYFVLRHVLVGNLALDTLVPLLVHGGMGTEAALRLFAGLALLLPVAGVIALGRVLQGATPWMALLAFAMAHSRYYAWGFLNYFFAVGLVLLVFAAWLHWRDQRPWLAASTLLLLGAVVMTSHLMGFGALALLVLSREAWLLWGARSAAPVEISAPPPNVGWWAWREHRGWPSRERWLALLPTLIALAACTLFYGLAFERGLALDVRWQDTPATRLRNLASPFVAYEVVPGLVVMALVVGLLLWLWRTHRVHLQPGWWASVGAVVLTFALMPSVIMNSHYAGARLLIVGALAFIAFSTLRLDRRGQVAVIVVALTATTIRWVEVDAQWAATSTRSAELREALLAVPPRAKVATVVAVGDKRFGEIHALRHVAAFAVIDRQAFMPNFFGFPFNGESVAFRAQAEAITKLLNKDHLMYGPDDEIPWDVLCAHYDAVLVVEEGRWPALPSCAARVLQAGPGFGLYALDG